MQHKNNNKFIVSMKKASVLLCTTWKAYSNMAHDQFSSYIKPQLNMKSAKLLLLHLGHAEQTKHSYQGALQSSKTAQKKPYL